MRIRPLSLHASFWASPDVLNYFDLTITAHESVQLISSAICYIKS